VVVRHNCISQFKTRVKWNTVLFWGCVHTHAWFTISHITKITTQASRVKSALFVFVCSLQVTFMRTHTALVLQWNSVIEIMQNRPRPQMQNGQDLHEHHSSFLWLKHMTMLVTIDQLKLSNSFLRDLSMANTMVHLSPPPKFGLCTSMISSRRLWSHRMLYRNTNMSCVTKQVHLLQVTAMMTLIASTRSTHAPPLRVTYFAVAAVCAWSFRDQ